MNLYEDFLNDLGVRESAGNYESVNSLGYLGKYQFGKDVLRDVGYYGKNGWTGKEINSIKITPASLLAGYHLRV